MMPKYNVIACVVCETEQRMDMPQQILPGRQSLKEIQTAALERAQKWRGWGTLSSFGAGVVGPIMGGCFPGQQLGLRQLDDTEYVCPDCIEKLPPQIADAIKAQFARYEARIKDSIEQAEQLEKDAAYALVDGPALAPRRGAMGVIPPPPFGRVEDF
jgi:hypothetical protein